MGRSHGLGLSGGDGTHAVEQSALLDRPPVPVPEVGPRVVQNDRRLADERAGRDAEESEQVLVPPRVRVDRRAERNAARAGGDGSEGSARSGRGGSAALGRRVEQVHVDRDVGPEHVELTLERGAGAELEQEGRRLVLDEATQRLHVRRGVAKRKLRHLVADTGCRGRTRQHDSLGVVRPHHDRPARHADTSPRRFGDGGDSGAVVAVGVQDRDDRVRKPEAPRLLVVIEAADQRAAASDEPVCDVVRMQPASVPAPRAVDKPQERGVGSQLEARGQLRLHGRIDLGQLHL